MGPRPQPAGVKPIRTENGQLAVYIFVDIAGRDLGGYAAEARHEVATEVRFQTQGPGVATRVSDARGWIRVEGQVSAMDSAAAQ
jgi:hypothetical protein